MADPASGTPSLAGATSAAISQQARDNPLLTVFAIPKPFTGRNEIIQRNAIRSWLQWTPANEILLFGDAQGTARVADELGVKHFPNIQYNEFGTPQLSDAFAGATESGRGRLLLYANADMILQRDFAAAAARLDNDAHRPFLAIGRRISVDVERLIDWQNADDISWLHQRCANARRESILCKDYFLYPRGWFANLPPFAVGRGNWDNWMVFAAKQMQMMVIDLSPSVLAIHQTHGHDHVDGRKRAAYLYGPEARSNQRLAGGRHWIRGSTSNWVLTPDRLIARRCSGLQLAFWADLPQVVRLGWQMLRE